MSDLFSVYDMAGHQLGNRIVMPPLTRARRPDYVPNAETALYYRQRASAGLIITEGTPVSEEGQGYINVPGLWSAEQTAGWRLVTDAVHADGGTIFSQLWHVGRVSHTSLQPGGKAPVSSTTTPVRDPKSKAYVFLEDGSAGFAEPSKPRALATEEVGRVVQDFVHAARNADLAGFDGIEIHAANGYLFEQFLNPVLNDRSDRYGGPVEDRARLILDTVDALVDVLGAGRVGIRLAPFNRQFDMPAYDAADTYLYLGRELAKRPLAYVHLNDNWALGASVISEEFLGRFRAVYPGTVILAGAMTKERAADLIGKGLIDLAAFGQPFIANPDLVARFRHDWPLNKPDRDTFYGGGAHGYTDYPTYAAGRVDRALESAS